MARGKKKKPKRRSKPRIRIKKTSKPALAGIIPKILPAIFALLIIGALIKGLLFLLVDSDYFVVETIRVDGNDVGRLVRPISVELASKKGVNIFSVDLKACESGIINRHPELKIAKVRRILPDTLEVTCAIRKPFLQVHSGRYYLASDDAVILPGAQRTLEPNLIVVTGIEISKRKLSSNPRAYSQELKKAISLIKDINKSGFTKRHGALSHVNIYDLENPVIHMDNGTKIEIGEYSFKEKVVVLEGVLNELESKGKSAKVIDLRFEDIVVIPR